MRFFQFEDTLDASGNVIGNHAGAEIIGRLPDEGKPFMIRKRGPVRKDGKQAHYICYGVPRRRQTLRLMFRDPSRSLPTARRGKSELLASCAGVMLFKEPKGKTAADLIAEQVGNGVKYVICPPHSLGIYAYTLASAMRIYSKEVARAWVAI